MCCCSPLGSQLSDRCSQFSMCCPTTCQPREDLTGHVRLVNALLMTNTFSRTPCFKESAPPELSHSLALTHLPKSQRESQGSPTQRQAPRIAPPERQSGLHQPSCHCESQRRALPTLSSLATHMIHPLLSMTPNARHREDHT